MRSDVIRNGAYLLVCEQGDGIGRFQRHVAINAIVLDNRFRLSSLKAVRNLLMAIHASL